MLRGIIFGLVVAVLGFGVAMLKLGPVEMSPVLSAPVAVPSAGDSTAAPDQTAPEQSAPDQTAPDQAAPAEGMTTPLDTAPPQPEAPVADTTTTAPATDSTAPDAAAPGAVMPDAVMPDTTMPDAAMPEATPPAADTAPTAPDQAAPEATPSGAMAPESDDTAATAPAMQDGAENAAEAASAGGEDDTAMAVGDDMPVPDAAMADDKVAPAAPDLADDSAPDRSADAAPAPSMPVVPDDNTTAESTEPGPEILTLPDGALPDPGVVTSRLPRIGDSTVPADDTPSPTLAPVPPLVSAAQPDQVADGVVTGRLPSIGAPAGGESAAPEAGSAPLPAFERNAIPFPEATGQPLLSFLLIDSGVGRDAMRDLDKLPFPVTVAVNAADSGVADAIDFYRGKGAEVVVIVPLPVNATPADVEVNLEAYTPLLDLAVAAMVEPEADFQTLGDGAVQFGAHLVAYGLGLVTFPSGLNTGHKAAQKEGVHAGLVFRDLDGEGQSGSVIRRFLDNAAFRARNEQGVIVVAHTKAETLQALLEWSLGTRAQNVTLAPVSAVLRAQ